MTANARQNSSRDYPAMLVERNRIEPAPRRVRGVLNGQPVFDTTRAVYVWEWPNYPLYYIPLEDVAQHLLVDEQRDQRQPLGPARRYGIRVGDEHRQDAARVFDSTARSGVAGTVRFEWSALDMWFEEEEEIFVHPRDPYTRVDALRSRRKLRVEVDGIVLAETTSPVLLFETGLPTRYYVDKTDLHAEHLVPTDTQTSCPYKGTTTRYWSVRTPDSLYDDLVWAYDFPLPAVTRIAGMAAFYNEKVDIILDGQLLPRPKTHFS